MPPFRGVVRTSIDFDQHASLKASEVDDKWPYRHLATEAMTANLPLAKKLPESPLAFSGCSSQRSCSLVRQLATQLPTPPLPVPPPQGGREKIGIAPLLGRNASII